MITFSCKVAGDIPMLQAHGTRLLALIGKSPRGDGIITLEQIPQALAALREAIAQESAPAQRTDDAQTVSTAGDETDVEEVGLRQRAFPLIQMLERALAAEQPVLWNVG